MREPGVSRSRETAPPPDGALACPAAVLALFPQRHLARELEMKILVAAFTAAAVLAPASAALAMCDRDHVKFTCADGQTWDKDAKRCVVVTG